MARVNRDAARAQASAWFSRHDAAQRYELRAGLSGASVLLSDMETASPAAEALAAVLGVIDGQDGSASFGLTADGLGLSVGVIK
jgi:hypothetical protein